MSYAGPASRGKRARPLEMDPSGLRNARSSRGPSADTLRAGESTARPPRSRSTPASASDRSWAGPALLAAGIALGVALGVGGALLFAPQSGEETRHALTRRARRVGHRGQDVWEDLRDELRRARRRRKAARQRARQHRDAAEIAD